MLGLDMANLIIYILKNGEKIPKNHKFLSFQIRGKKKEIAKKKTMLQMYDPRELGF